MATVRHLGLFPFCLKSKQVVDQTVFAKEYKIAMSLAEVMAMFWRVKTWRLTSHAGSIEVSARRFYEFTQDPQALIYDLGEPKESFLVALSFLNGHPLAVQNVSYFATSTNTGDENAPPVNFESFNGQMFYESEKSNLATAEDNRTPVLFDEDSNDFWPQFAYSGVTPPLFFQNDYYNIEGENIAFNTTEANLFQGSTEVGAVTLSFLGKNFIAPVYIETPSPPLEDDEAELVAATEQRNAAVIAHAQEHASGTAQAIEYWPYDPNDGGGPIYDSATGEQLRSFPS